MQYALIKTNTTGNELYKLYDEYKQAERKLKKSFSENGKILEIPEVRAGLRLYRNKDNSYYGTIIKETKSLFLVNDTENIDEMSTPILKDNMIKKWFVSGFLKDGIEDIDERFEMNFYKEEDENEEGILDELTKNESEE